MSRHLSCDWSQKAVTPARDGFDETRVVGGIIKGRAQLLHGSVEAVVKLDERVGRPEPLADLFPCDQFTRTIQQHPEDLEGLVLKFDPQATLREDALPEIGLEETKARRPGLGWGGVHIWQSSGSLYGLLRAVQKFS